MIPCVLLTCDFYGEQTITNMDKILQHNLWKGHVMVTNMFSVVTHIT